MAVLTAVAVVIGPCQGHIPVGGQPVLEPGSPLFSRPAGRLGGRRRPGRASGRAGRTARPSGGGAVRRWGGGAQAELGRGLGVRQRSGKGPAGSPSTGDPSWS